MHTKKFLKKNQQKYLYILPECHFVAPSKACELIKLMSQLKQVNKSKTKQQQKKNRQIKANRRNE